MRSDFIKMGPTQPAKVAWTGQRPTFFYFSLPLPFGSFSAFFYSSEIRWTLNVSLGAASWCTLCGFAFSSLLALAHNA